jgi:bifunctional non-homologous end joining protein LigD
MKNCRWLEPGLVAQIEFTEWTPDGHLRSAAFVGLREDKDPREVTHEPDQRS